MTEVLVADWVASARWYVNVLGLKLAFEDPEGRFLLLEAGPARVALKEGPPLGGRGAVRLVLRVNDVEATRERLIALGVKVGPVVESAEGYREVHLLDPDGTPIRLFAWVGREG